MTRFRVMAGFSAAHVCLPRPGSRVTLDVAGCVPMAHSAPALAIPSCVAPLHPAPSEFLRAPPMCTQARWP